jgi:serpin B
MWVEAGLEIDPKFVERSRDFYSADVRELDFADPSSINTINTWISDQTQGQVDSLISEIDEDVILYLVNALLFKGQWGVNFDPMYTQKQEFFLPDGRTIIVPMMLTQAEDLPFFQEEGFQAIGLPFGDGQVRMYAFLPSAESNMEAFLSELSHSQWVKWMSKFEPQEVMVRMPQFQINSSTSVKDALESLGMSLAFSDQADFSNLATGGAFIGDVLHTTSIEVDETGTTAAAASAVEILKGEPSKSLVFDRPFFFAIVDEASGMVLFMGTVVEP